MTSLLWADGEEYLSRTRAPFIRHEVNMSTLRKAIPSKAFHRSLLKSMVYCSPLLFSSAVLFYIALNIDNWSALVGWKYPEATTVFQNSLWLMYWIVQPILWSGIWVLGHEAGHNNISGVPWVNHVIGFILHSFLFVPYFSYKYTHMRHHQNAGSLEKDEAYVPYERSDFKLPPPSKAKQIDYEELFEDSPLFTLAKLLVMQFVGLQLYFAQNTMGSKQYPPGANHWSPWSALFRPGERFWIVISDLGIFSMILLLRFWIQQTSFATVAKLYFIPFLFTNHWVVAMTFLQHTCSSVPFYRKGTWNRTAGALSTVDRPFMGWVGRVFLLGVNHFHTTHHLFATIPFYNLPMAHESIRPLLGNMYNFDSTGIFRALWRSFKECLFVEDEGDVVFYKDGRGEHKRSVAPSVR